ncbi:AraC family transcriptional regulator [Dyella sp.]|uniref:AraC family transcriptional regulator n=1 Tax=Dyella sp. TaxID=1869338 RepID=UPI002D79EA28|nr:AraC family transcriptional regulator [Dyella sp.]HET7331890.1 AraC family transcriptional regulator [Dyella sp.]
MGESAGTGNVAPMVAQLLLRACRALDSDVHAARVEIQRALELLPDASVRAHAKPDHLDCSVRGLAPWQAQKVIDHVRANLEAPIRVEEMASVTRLSTSYFFRAFRLSFCMPPHAYVRAVRLARARELLLDSDEQVSWIAVACGFADQAHFSRVFRREMGCTPRRWRRERRGISTEASMASSVLVHER